MKISESVVSFITNERWQRWQLWWTLIPILILMNYHPEAHLHQWTIQTHYPFQYQVFLTEEIPKQELSRRNTTQISVRNFFNSIFWNPHPFIKKIRIYSNVAGCSHLPLTKNKEYIPHYYQWDVHIPLSTALLYFMQKIFNINGIFIFMLENSLLTSGLFIINGVLY